MFSPAGIRCKGNGFFLMEVTAVLPVLFLTDLLKKKTTKINKINEFCLYGIFVVVNGKKNMSNRVLSIFLFNS